MPENPACQECSEEVYARGLCPLHYDRWLRATKDQRIPRTKKGEPMRFLRSLPDTDECVVWPFGTTSSGYGVVQPYDPETQKTRVVRATHVALELNGRPRPPDKPWALHSCDLPLCVNPKHLSWGTPQDNSRQMMDRGRGRGQYPSNPEETLNV